VTALAGVALGRRRRGAGTHAAGAHRRLPSVDWGPQDDDAAGPEGETGAARYTETDAAPGADDRVAREVDGGAAR
jgi:hypothetical protein